MKSWLLVTTLLANVAMSTWLTRVEATACAKICYTTELTGFGPGGIPGCSCSGSEAGERTGEGDCNCGQCYTKSKGVVYGFAINSDGTCTYGMDCGSCDYSSSTSSNSVTSASSLSPPPLPSPPPTPSLTPSTLQHSFTSEVTSSSSTSASSSSNATSSSTIDHKSISDTAIRDRAAGVYREPTDSNASSVRGGLETWQMVLAICCSVLVFIVAVVSVCSCYCKVRSRLNEHDDARLSYYNQQSHVLPACGHK